MNRLEEQFEIMPVLLSADLWYGYGIREPYAVHTYSDRIELIWILEGTGTYSCNGILYPVRPKDVIVCNSGMAHGMSANTQDGLHCIQLFVHSVRISGMEENCLAPIGYCPVLHGIEGREQMEELFFQVLAGSRRQNIETAALTELLCRLYELVQNQFPARPMYIGWRAVQYIDQHYMEASLTPEQIAEILQVKLYTMARAFQRIIGYTPLQYLNRRRICAAQSMLLQTDTAVDQIAETAGFGSLKRFSNTFRKQIGVTPQAYRHIWKNDTIQ